MNTLNKNNRVLITTIKEKCRICYTCVRECPAKAIRVSNGQAEIIPERCIGCGNCFQVCSQHAKQVRDSIEDVKSMLSKNGTKVAIIAPSFPAEFKDITYQELVGMIKHLGFDFVTEVAFGADLVSKQYKELIENNPHNHYIASTCPAIVSYVRKYHPKLVHQLAPIVSPMVASAKVVKQKYGEDVKLVFIGPCFAKKEEGAFHQDIIDFVLTFTELRELFKQEDIRHNHIMPEEFDPPYPKKGVIYPLEHGIVQAADLDEDLMKNSVVSAAGRKNFVEAIKEFENGDLEANLLDVLCCDGCIMGPGMTTTRAQYSRQNSVSKYARRRVERLDENEWNDDIDQYKNINITTIFEDIDQRLPIPSKSELKKILAKMGKVKPEDELNCRACGYNTCIEHAIAVFRDLAEVEMCLPYSIEKLKETSDKLSISYQELANTQQALIQSEKLASMGQLAAGIAHEVNNPLGVVLLYAHILRDSCSKESEIYEDLTMIVEQSDRCKKIVSGLLNFARKNKVILKDVDINRLIKHCVSLVITPKNIKIDTNSLTNEIMISLDSDQMTQVFTNIFTNAFEAMPKGGTIKIVTKLVNNDLKIEISDTGTGISKQNIKKVFEPFFTTKHMGKGTGLGLAVIYGIIKMHRGQIIVESNDDPTKGETGTTFIITLPIKREELVDLQE